MKRPSTFTDWRSLWHSEAKTLGWTIAYSVARNGRIVATKDIWDLIRRVNRIRKRLDVESEVRDVTWCQAMMEMIIAENRNRTNRERQKPGGEE